MGNKYKGPFGERNKNKQKAEAWFDRTDDSQPFDAFGSAENKKRIGNEIFSHIEGNMHKRRFERYAIIKLAAAVLLFLSVGIALSRFVRQYQFDHDQLTWSEYKSAPGHLDKILLADSSIAYLRPGTILKVPQAFKGHLREVQLVEGEAFFEVKHDADHPFIVHTGNLKTQVLGTSFLIKNYRKLNNIQVSVATGKVAVMNGAKLLGFLTPQQELSFNRLTEKADKRVTSYAELADTWKNGEYNLKNSSVEELTLALENIYAYKIILKSPGLQKLNITMQFNMKDSIRDILDQLKLIHNVKYTIKNKEVILMK